MGSNLVSNNPFPSSESSTCIMVCIASVLLSSLLKMGVRSVRDSVKPENESSSNCICVFHQVKYTTYWILGVAKLKMVKNWIVLQKKHPLRRKRGG